MNWLLFAILTAVFTSLAAITGKKILFKLHAMEFSATVAFLNLIISIPLFFVIDYSKITLVPVIIIFFVAVLAAIAFLHVAKALRHMELSDASPLIGLAPAIAAFLAFIFLGESLSLLQVTGLIVIVIGSYVLETRHHKGLLEPFRVIKKSKYIHYIFLALFMYAITSNLDRYVISRFDFQPAAYIAIAHLFLAIIFVIMMMRYHDGFKGVKHGLRVGGWWILLAALFTTSYRYFQMTALQVAYVGLVLGIKRLSILLTTVFGGELFHEHNLFKKTIAALIIIGGTILILI